MTTSTQHRAGRLVPVGRNGGIRKLCGCTRRRWPKCRHSWHLNFSHDGHAHRFSLDVEHGRPLEGKTEAEALAETIRTAIRAGTFRRRRELAAAEPTTPAPTADVIKMESFGGIYFDRRGKPATSDERGHLRRLCAFVLPGTDGTLGAKPLGAITEDDVELFFLELRERGAAASTWNKYLQLTKALFRWARRKKYLTFDPVADSEMLRRRTMAQRHRRLVPDRLDDRGRVVEPGEERRLLAASSPALQRLIVGALDTGCRRGELLSLRWRDVNLRRGELHVRAAVAKTRRHRDVPISTRLSALLSMSLTALEVQLTGPTSTPEQVRERERTIAEAFVFGDALGRRVGTIKKQFETAVLKAHGHRVRWAKGGLASECRAQLRDIDLHFHDLRHEAGSRFLEQGWPIHHVQAMLGHANLSQTSTYLNVVRGGLQDSMRRFEGVSCENVATDGATEHRPDRNEDRRDGGNPLVN